MLALWSAGSPLLRAPPQRPCERTALQLNPLPPVVTKALPAATVPLSLRRPGDETDPGPLALRCERPASARWGGTQASGRPPYGADRRPPGTGCLEGHHTSGPQRVHLLGRRCEA